MRSLNWLAWLAAGSLVLAGALVASPLAGVARQDSTPPAGAEISEDETEQAFTETFYLDRCEWSSTGGNAFFSLEPGFQQILRGDEDGVTVEAIVTVLDETEMVGEIETRVVEERETEDGEVVEVSLNYFAVCAETNNVFYFGESVDDYEDGEVADHSGAWRADEGENQPGLIVPGQPLLGARYYQEIAPGIALDRAEIIELGVQIETPAGTFEDCFRTEDSTPLEPDAREVKTYCPGVGNVQDESLLLAYAGPAADAPETATPAAG